MERQEIIVLETRTKFIIEIWCPVWDFMKLKANRKEAPSKKKKKAHCQNSEWHIFCAD